MYLATLTRGQTKHYEIRQSLPGDDHRYLEYQIVFDLGGDPGRYIERLSDDICYFSAELEDRLQQETSEDASLILEELLWDFLPAEEQTRLSIFRHRGKARVSALSEGEPCAPDVRCLSKDVRMGLAPRPDLQHPTWTDGRVEQQP